MPAAFDLKASLELLELPLDEVRRRLDIEHGETQEDVRYERLEGVTMLYNRDAFAGRVYIRDGKVEIVYIPSGSALANTTVRSLTHGLRSRPKEMRSRAGKEFTHTVYAGDGIAFSADGDDVRFVEVFRPRSLKEYLAEIYRDPGPFTR